MKFISTIFHDVFLIEPKIHKDERGIFIENYRFDQLKKNLKLKDSFCQENQVISSKNVFRGFHFQNPPHEQSKLIRVSKGKILDFVVNINKKSKNYGKYAQFELSDKNNRVLYIPRGYAHGYLVIEDETIVIYNVDNYYNKRSEGGILYNDTKININWPISVNELIISRKDKNFKRFNW